MVKRRLPWWQLPAIITGCVAALGAATTLILGAAKWLTLPEKVEAGETKNIQQDKQLDRLITLQEYYRQQQLPNQSAPSAPMQFREWDDDSQTMWCCPGSTQDEYDRCWKEQRWKWCDR